MEPTLKQNFVSPAALNAPVSTKQMASKQKYNGKECIIFFNKEFFSDNGSKKEMRKLDRKIKNIDEKSTTAKARKRAEMVYSSASLRFFSPIERPTRLITAIFNPKKRGTVRKLQFIVIVIAKLSLIPKL